MFQFTFYMCLDPINRNEPEECCGRPDHLKNKYCNEIKIPEDDYFYKNFNVKCQDFVRAFPGVKPDCKLGNVIIDQLSSHVYILKSIGSIADFSHFRFQNTIQSAYSGDRW